MEPAPFYEFWWRFAAILAAEVSIVALAAWIVEKLRRSGAWRCAVWHSCIVGLVALVAAETSGTSRIVAACLSPRPTPIPVEVKQTLVPAIVVAEPIGAHEVELSPAVSASNDPVFASSVNGVWWPATLWLAGFLVVAIWTICLRALFAVTAARRSAPVAAEVLECANEVARRLRVRRKFTAVELPQIRTPVAFGILRRTIGLPAGFEQTFTRVQQEVMLAHELAHLAGRDAAWHLFTDFVAALLWWHPIVWWVRRRLHFATECAADEASLIVKDGPRVLAQTLVREGRSLLDRRYHAALGVKGLHSGLARRVTNLIAMEDTRGPESSRRAVLLTPCLPLLLVGGAMACFAWNAPVNGTPHEEWRNSIAARAYAAVAEATTLSAEEDTHRISGLLGDAKIFYHAGKLDHAEGLCEEVLKIDPANSEALQLSAAIAVARHARSAELASSAPSYISDMERVLPADRFIAPQQIGSFEHVISNAVAFSSRQRGRDFQPAEPAKRIAPTSVVYKSKGLQRINKLLRDIRLPVLAINNLPLATVLKDLSEEIKQRDPDKKGFDLMISPAPSRAPIDPATGESVGTERKLIDPEKININIAPSVGLHDLTLTQVLDAICKASQPQLHFTVEDYAVVFLPGDAPSPLYTRTYRVDVDAVLAHFADKRGALPVDVDVDPPRRENKPRDLIAHLRGFLNEAGVDLAPPKAFFFNDRLGVLMVRAHLEDFTVIEQALSRFTRPTPQVMLEINVAEFRNEAAHINSSLGVSLTDGTTLTDPQFRLVIRALENIDKIHVLTPQKVVAQNNRHASITLPSVEPIDPNRAAMHASATVLADNHTVSVSVIVSGREPAVTTIRDQQTLIMHLPPVTKTLADGVTVRVLKRVVFVTVTLIDAAGNRLHDPESPDAAFDGIWKF
jgi:beta-lactamase regulating signal transducer with metallopeptidase domain